MITMEKIDYVMDVTGASYEVVRVALLNADGNVDIAIKAIKNSVGNVEFDTEGKKKKDFINFDDIKKAIMDLWEQGNTNKLVVEKNNEVVYSLSLNISVLGVALAPLAAIVGVGAGLINDYDFKIIMKDGNKLDLKEYIKNLRR